MCIAILCNAQHNIWTVIKCRGHNLGNTVRNVYISQRCALFEHTGRNTLEIFRQYNFLQRRTAIEHIRSQRYYSIRNCNAGQSSTAKEHLLVDGFQLTILSKVDCFQFCGLIECIITNAGNIFTNRNGNNLLAVVAPRYSTKCCCILHRTAAAQNKRTIPIQHPLDRQSAETSIQYLTVFSANELTIFKLTVFAAENHGSIVAQTILVEIILSGIEAHITGYQRSASKINCVAGLLIRCPA